MVFLLQGIGLIVVRCLEGRGWVGRELVGGPFLRLRKANISNLSLLLSLAPSKNFGVGGGGGCVKVRPKPS